MKSMKTMRAISALLVCGAVLWMPALSSHAETDSITFDMAPSAALLSSGCLPKARARVVVKALGDVESMVIKAQGLAPNAEYDVFVIQVPNAPFGLSWYQGDMQADAKGNARVKFLGRFNRETFIVAPGSAPAPLIHKGGSPFPDARSNPATAPVHTFHLGIWFNSPDDAAAVGCPVGVTPFNGDHDAGVQVLNTQNFPDRAGPLFDLEP